MKLFELLDPLVTDPRGNMDNVANLQGFLEDMFGQELKRIGRGGFAIVYEKPNDPGTVTKVSKGVQNMEILDEDGYLGWVRAIAGYRKATGNPYLPKIYSIKFFFDMKDSHRTDMGIFRGPVKYVVELERLEEFDNPPDYDADDEEMYSSSNAHSVYNQYVAMAKRMFKDYEPSDDHVYNVIEDIVESLVAYQNRRPAKLKIKDKQLAQALALARKAEKKGDHATDIRGSNIMVRRTPYGLQPVITDPLS